MPQLSRKLRLKCVDELKPRLNAISVMERSVLRGIGEILPDALQPACQIYDIQRVGLAVEQLVQIALGASDRGRDAIERQKRIVEIDVDEPLDAIARHLAHGRIAGHTVAIEHRQLHVARDRLVRDRRRRATGMSARSDSKADTSMS